MRPRHYTAENAACLRSSDSTARGFNEAAALHRGKRTPHDTERDGIMRASMRPRHYTAENRIRPSSGI